MNNITKKILTTLLHIFFLGAAAQLAEARDALIAPDKVKTLCQNCHGMDGIATLLGAPNLSGQKREYLQEQLRSFRAGARQNQQMTIITKKLTDEDIESLANWYSSMRITVQMPK